MECENKNKKGIDVEITVFYSVIFLHLKIYLKNWKKN